MTEPEPRRSVRATKGQHTKAFDQLENGPEPKRRQTTTKKNTKKPAEKEDKEEEDDEIIRCICGATSQDDDDANEPWIACDKCGAWQHNVCVGMSVFQEDLTKDYFCEQCAPQDHKETLEAIKKGEKPWEDRRQKYEDEKKRKKGGKKAKAKRVSDTKDRASPNTAAATASNDTRGASASRLSNPPPTSVAASKPQPSPSAELKMEDTAPLPQQSLPKGKRKSRDHSQGPASKQRKILPDSTRISPSEPTLSQADSGITPKVNPSTPSDHSAPTASTAVPTVPEIPESPQKQKQQEQQQPEPEMTAPDKVQYAPPSDLPETIQKLEGPRRQAALAIQKSLEHAIDQSEKKNLFSLPQNIPKNKFSERLAIEIERAYQDTHPNTSHNASQLRTLSFSLKNNIELAAQVLNRTLPPTKFVVMSGDELATKELQRENAEMKARADKQSILVSDDGPRVRRTHKGEEFIETDNVHLGADEAPAQLHKQGIRETTAQDRGVAAAADDTSRRTSSTPLRLDTQAQQPAKPSNFDIGKVFSSVKSPSGSHQRRSSTQVRSAGPVDDPDVDRLLEDDGNDSPPYSPTEEIDPDVVWRGPLTMTNVADISTVAKFVGGADLSKVRGIAWKDLIPALLSVCGRIPEEKAVPYLCGLRYNNQIDLVITSLSPANPADEASRKQFLAVIDYFRNKKRYGVVGERKLGNVRDTYLVPVSEGDGPIPEPMQNISDHTIPAVRAEPMLLMIFVVRDEKQTPIPLEQQRTEMRRLSQSGTPTQATPVPPPRHPSIPAPTWSPATPQGPFSTSTFTPPTYSQTPIPPPKIPGQPAPVMAPRPHPPAAASPPAPPQSTSQDPNLVAVRAAQAEGEMKARQVLGPLFGSSTVTFLLPHAARMKEGEWNAVRRCLEKDPRARDDLQLLSKLLTEEGNNARKNNGPSPPAPHNPSPGVVQTTLAAATAGVHDGAPASK